MEDRRWCLYLVDPFYPHDKLTLPSRFWLWPAYQPRLLWTLEVWTSRLEFSFSNSLLISYFIYLWLAALQMKISKFLKGSTSQYCVKTEWLNWLKIKEKNVTNHLALIHFDHEGATTNTTCPGRSPLTTWVTQSLLDSFPFYFPFRAPIDSWSYLNDFFTILFVPTCYLSGF